MGYNPEVLAKIACWVLPGQGEKERKEARVQQKAVTGISWNGGLAWDKWCFAQSFAQVAFGIWSLTPGAYCSLQEQETGDIQANVLGPPSELKFKGELQWPWEEEYYTVSQPQLCGPKGRLQLSEFLVLSLHTSCRAVLLMTPAKVRNQDLGRLRLKVTSATLARAGEDWQGLTPWLLLLQERKQDKQIKTRCRRF